ncbi:hypothetical protein [Nocardia sp. NPDC060249]|uniref:hypothetical protein n=1 Tax=Nocardia sp. NPDC060249 TaxID=3347082 RepID=UPI003663CE23
MESDETPLTQAQREDFWRREAGWSLDLSEAERQRIEQKWPDRAIRMAESFGY